MARANRTGFESRGHMIDYLQALSNRDFDECIGILKECQWDLHKAVNKLFPEPSLTNSGFEHMTSLAIKKKNDQHLAEYRRKVGYEVKNESNNSHTMVMGEIKRIGIAAHNNKKKELVECLRKHRNVLLEHRIYGTGTTGLLVADELQIPVNRFESGPLGGDQQLGAKITMRELDILIFFVDPLDVQAHEDDVRALIRLAQVYGIVCATTAATVDFIMQPKLMSDVHIRKVELQAYKPK